MTPVASAQDTVSPATLQLGPPASLDAGLLTPERAPETAPIAEHLAGVPAPTPLTLGERFLLQSRATFGPAAFLTPALGAGYSMANPPAQYPHEWRDGLGGFGRNYGAELGTNTVGGMVQFATAALDREDPRYYAAEGSGFAGRVVHAVAFTVVNRSNGGNRMIAVSNFVGAGAAGFAGNLWEPDGFNDTSHALVRGALQFATYGGHNLFLEFSPDVRNGLRKLHLARHKYDAGNPQGISER